MLSPDALKYTVNHLLSVALPTGTPLQCRMERGEGDASLHIADWRLRVALLDDGDVDSLLAGKLAPETIASADGCEKLPLFRGTQATRSQSTDIVFNPDLRELYVPYDIITPSFLMLSRWEEYQESPRDQHNRFPYVSSMAAHYGFIHLPIVDEYAMLLRQWITEQVHPDIVLRPRAPRVVPTHDIDHLCRYTGTFQALRSIFGRDLLINRSLPLVRQSWQEYREWCIDKRQDPYILAIAELIDHARRHGEQAVFFIKAQVQGEYDCTYDIQDPLVNHVVDMIQKNGMKVGLHGSYRSYDDPELYLQEKNRLEKITGEAVTVGRQHFLRFNLLKNYVNAGYSTYGGQDSRQMMEVTRPSTLEMWQAVGLGDDYTLGYAEQPGFRCGTCHPFRLYNLFEDRPTDIVEHPLVLMDGSLFDYLELDIGQSRTLFKRLRERCNAVEGDFVYLWHNHTVGRNYREMYERVVAN